MSDDSELRIPDEPSETRSTRIGFTFDWQELPAETRRRIEEKIAEKAVEQAPTEQIIRKVFELQQSPEEDESFGGSIGAGSRTVFFDENEMEEFVSNEIHSQLSGEAGATDLPTTIPEILDRLSNLDSEITQTQSAVISLQEIVSQRIIKPISLLMMVISLAGAIVFFDRGIAISLIFLIIGFLFLLSYLSIRERTE